MSDHPADPSKRPPECDEANNGPCPHLKETGGGFSGEQYRCEVCGRAYFLDYDDMR